MTRAARGLALALAGLVLAATAATRPAGPRWVVVPAGTFTMGCEPTSSCPERQAPRTVTFATPFEMHRTEVTVGDFRAFVAATSYRTLAEQQGLPWTWKTPRGYRLREQQPVMFVAAPDAEAYCAWAGGRLPYETEWTWAFRANETITGRLWWNTDPRYVWYRENSDYTPQPVGRTRPNAWGLHDMEGNAWEWTRADVDNGARYWIRGGSWISCYRIEGRPTREPEADPGGYSRSGSDGLSHIRDDIGFRCVRAVG
jgi:formylglycine-generating enzyme